jgi:hypothetical protein
MIAEAERKQILASRLDAFLKGEFAPSNSAERLEYAEVANASGRFLAAVQLYSEAFAENPRLLDDPTEPHGFEAGCAAADLALGHDPSAQALTPDEQSRWRRQALEWLRADSDFLRVSFDAGEAAVPQVLDPILSWKAQRCLTELRDPKRLENLPAKERAAWLELWADLDAFFEEVRS